MSIIRVFNMKASKDFKRLITEIAENIIYDFYSLPYLNIKLIKGPEEVDELSETTIFARANALGFLLGDEPTIEISTAIKWSAKSYESITATVAHEIAHLELTNKYAKPLLSLNLKSPLVYYFSNKWSDYFINSFLVAKGYGPSLLSHQWEINDGHPSLLVFWASQGGKVTTIDERRMLLRKLMQDLISIFSLAKDARLKQFTDRAYKETINAAVSVLKYKTVKRVIKSISEIEKMTVEKWIESVLNIYESQL